MATAVVVSGGGVTGVHENKKSKLKFHQRCGRRITLSNGNRTAARSIRDFSHALVFSAEPLNDDELFEVVIEKKSLSWGGSIEIGVTAEPPDKLDLPSCATAMRNGSWVMSGIDVRKDGVCLIEFYGIDLESLNERDRVGVMRTSSNELLFYVNGASQGIAARNMPKQLWALVDLYGRCVQVSICPADAGATGDSPDVRNHQSQVVAQTIDIPIVVDLTVGATNASSMSIASSQVQSSCSTTTLVNASTTPSSATMQLNTFTASTLTGLQACGDTYDMNDRLRFHTRCGSLVKLSPNCRSAERRRPLDEFNNGVVMTHRPLRDNELFEIRIDKLVDKWSGSIEVGVTTHNPTVLHFPATMTNMRSGTIMMSGCGILTNGKGTRRQYGEFNLDELRHGDRVGMMRMCNGNLHYYINGKDQGVAATRVGSTLWGVIDLYGMTIKVTIVDRDEREQQNLVTRRNNMLSMQAANSLQNASAAVAPTPALSLLSPDSDLNSIAAAAIQEASTHRSDDRLTFHALCGSHATVTHSGRTALRPNASDDFNNGVVLTRRPLRPNELFQVRLERVVTKWAGSIEMGVTTHSAGDLDFPFTMTNVRSGTWMMTGNGVMHNGITVIEQYGQSLDRLQVGDRVGVVRKDDGTLHFWVNGVDQGPAAANVPERIFGVIDLYGQAAQASIIDTSECASPDTGNSTISNTTLYSEPPIRFHTIHGKNAGLSNGCLTAARPNSLAEFNDAIVFSSRPLRQRELFEVVLETMVRHWSGNIEIGVTGVRPEDIQLTVNATDLEANDTIILCGSMIFHNRKTIRSNILVDLDTLAAGTRVGVMRNGDFIHFYIDGLDQGPAIECRATNIWAVVDLYGQCAQVSITQGQPELQAPYATSENSQSCQATSVIQPGLLETKHRWTCISGSITLSNNWTCATRMGGMKAALSRSLIFSEHPLNLGSPFEIKIMAQDAQYAGSLKVGITDLDLTDEHVRKNLPTCIRRIPANVWYVFGNEVYQNQHMLQRSTVSMEWLRVGDRISLELTPTHTLRILLNAENVNIQYQNITSDVYVVVELMGSTMSIQVTSTQGPTSPLRPCSLRLQDSLDFGIDPLNKQDSMLESIDSETQTYEFSEIHGKNIKLLEDRHSAERLKSYNQALVFVPKPLCRGESITVRIDAINENWNGTIGLGVCACSQLNAIQLPPSIMQCKRPCWVATHDFINLNGHKQPSKFGQPLADIEVGSTITMSLSHGGVLVITLDDCNLDALATNIPNHVYPVFDLYGKCTKITLLANSDVRAAGTPIIEEANALEDDAAVQDQAQAEEPEQDEAELPQCEKANLEMNEKEKDQAIKESNDNDTNIMTRSVMESVSENLHFNMSVRNRSLEHSRTDASSSCCLRESLQLQHNTNLNIQRSQSTQRFQNSLASPTSLTSTTITTATTNIYDDNKEYEEIAGAAAVLTTSIDEILSCNSKENLLLDFPGHDDNNFALQRCCLDTNYCNDVDADMLTETNVNAIGNSNQRAQHGSIDSNLDDNSHSENMMLLLHFHQEQQMQQQLQQQQQHLQQQQYQQRTTDTSELYFDSVQSLETDDNKDCEYLRTVQQFCMSLVLPQQFFQPRSKAICFCSNCNASKSEKLNGWVYLQLNQEIVNTTNADQILDPAEWLPLYYVTRVDKIRATLDRGHPVPIEQNMESHAACSNKKDEPGTHLELHFSPNASDIPPVNEPHKYATFGSQYNIGTVFEVHVRRQSLCATDCNNKSETGNLIDIDFEPSCSSRANPTAALSQTSMNDRKWFTKEAGACVITALVLRLEKLDEESADEEE